MLDAPSPDAHHPDDPQDGVGEAALDHLVLAVPDLEAACAALTRQTGVRPVRGGAHPGRGTRNALLGLRWSGGTRCYLELLGPDPDQVDVPPEKTMLGLGHLGSSFQPRVHGWAVRPQHLATTLDRARSLGIDVGEPAAASRITTSGTSLSWEMAVPHPLGLGGLQPFLVDWQGGAHPCDDPMPVLDLLRLDLLHPDPAGAQRTLGALGVRAGVEQADEPRLVATLGSPAGTVVLGAHQTGGPSQRPAR